MKSVAGIAAVAVLAVAVAGCSSESYYGPPYASSYPSSTYYRNTSGYTNPQYSPRRAYDGYWDYQRNYRGIHASPEFSSMPP